MKTKEMEFLRIQGKTRKDISKNKYSVRFTISCTENENVQ